MELVPDIELERLATTKGPKSYEAKTLAALRERRAKDEQVFCFRVGNTLFVGPMPDAETELQMLLASEVAKRLAKALIQQLAPVVPDLELPIAGHNVLAQSPAQDELRANRHLGRAFIG